MPDQPVKRVVIYHADCPDGLGAAWGAWRLFGDQETKYFPCAHGDEFPVPDSALEGANVYFVDFSLKRDALLTVARKCLTLTILDHHQTAEADLRGISEEAQNIAVVFDMKRSGAVITWEHLHSTAVPIFLQYVQDRDLWRFLLPDSELINDYIRVYVPSGPPDFDIVDRLAAWFEDSEHLRIVADRGRTLMMAKRCAIRRIVLTSARTTQWEGHTVAHANATMYHSEVAHELAKTPNPQPDFGIAYFRRGDQWVYSLRSIGDFDVSEVAKRFGGGGHHNAAGFESKDFLFNEES